MDVKGRRKGVVISMIAILLSTIFVILFSPSYERSLQERTAVTGMRVHAVNAYIADFERITDGVTAQLSVLALESLYNYTATTGQSLGDVEEAFRECMLTGNFTNQGSSHSCALQRNRTVPVLMSQVVAFANTSLHISTDVSVTNITIYQTHAADVEINITLNYTITDYTAVWVSNRTRTLILSIDGLSDPLIGMNTTGAFRRQIRITNVSDIAFNYAAFSAFYQKGEYRVDPSAPNYLMRFEHDLSNSSCCGIETVLNATHPSIPDVNKSYVDYLYYDASASDCTQVYVIAGLPQKLKLDEMHAGAVYGVWGNSTQLCS